MRTTTAATHLCYGEMDDKSMMPGYWRVEEAPGARFYAYTNSKERARLISAAPAMLDRLEDCEQFLEDQLDAEPADYQAEELLRLVRDVLRLATGIEQP